MVIQDGTSQFLQLIMVVMTMFAIMLYRVAVIVSMYETTKGTFLAGYAPLITSLSASIINLIAIVVLNQVRKHFLLES